MSFRKSKFFKSTRTGLWAALLVIVIFFVVSMVLLYEPLTGLHNSKLGLWVMTCLFAISILLIMWWRTNKLNHAEETRDRLYRENEEKAAQMKGVYERISDGFFALDKNWRFVYVNKKTGELSKRNPGTLIGKNIWEEFPETLGSDTYKAYHKAMADQQYASNIDYNEPLDLWYESNIYPSPDGLSVFLRDITKMKKTEKALEKSDAFSRGVLASLSSCVAVIDERGEIITVNKAWENFATENGVTTLERVSRGSNYFDVCNKAAAAGDDIAAQAVKGIQSVLKKETKVFELQYPCHAPDKQRWFLLRVMLFENGSPMAVVVHNNITEIVLSKQKLEESESHLRTIYNTEPECIKILGPNGELLDMNPAGLAMIEADSLEIVKGKSVLGIIAPKDRDAFARLTQNVFNGESGILEFEITGFKGTHRLLETHAVPLRDDNGKIISLLSVTRDVTERRKAEEAILKSEQRYQTLAEISPVGIFHTDAEGNTTYVNPRWCQISGLSFENALGNGWFNAVHEEDKNTLTSSWQQATKNQELSLSEYRFVRPDGTIAWVMGQAFPERNLENKIVGYVGTTTDITERKLAEEKLRKSERKLREITASLPGVVYQFSMAADGKAVFRFLSDGVNKYLDVSVEDIYKDSSLLFSAVHPDDIGRLMSAIALSNKNLDPLTIVYRILIKDGTYIWVRSDSIPVLLKEGTVLRNGSLIDITATKEAEEELNTAHKQLLFHVENAPLGYIEWDNQLFVKSWSKKAEEIFGWSEREFIEKQKNGFSLVYEEDVPRMSIVAGQLKSGVMERNSITHRNYTKDGRVIWCEWFNSVLKNKDGNVITIMSLVQDVTERKLAEERIKESEAKYRTLMQQAGDSIVLFDATGQILEANESVRQLLGYSGQKYRKMSLKDFVFEEDIKKSPLRFDLLKNGESTVTRRRLKRKDGTAVETEVHAKMLSDGRYLVVARDLTERIKSEQKLRESEMKYRTMVERNLAGIYQTTIQGKILSCNDAFVKMLGYNSQKDLLQKNAETFYFSDTNRNDFLTCLGEKGELNDREIMLKKKDGSPVYMIENCSLRKDLIIGEDIIEGVVMDITERKKIENALHESEETFRRLFDESADSILLLDDTGFARCNQAAASILGYSSPQEVFIKQPWEISPKKQPDGRLSTEKAAAMIANALKNGYNRFEWIHTKADGTEFPVEVMLTPIILKGKQSFYTIWRDITERKKAEQALTQSEHRYRSLVEQASDGIVMADLLGNIIEVNSALCSMFGYTREEALQKNITFFLDPKNTKLKPIRFDLLGKGHSLLVERRAVHKNGNQFDIEISSKLIGEGKLLSIIRDISERKKAQEQIRLSEEKYRSFFDQSADAIFIFDEDGRFLDMNTVSTRLLGYTKEELRKMSMFDVVFKEDLAENPIVLELLATGEAVIRQRTLKKKDGTFVEVEIHSKKIPDGKYLGLVRDITERKKAEKQIRDQEKRYRALIDTAPDATVIVNEEGIIQIANQQAVKLFGYTSAELTGMAVESLIPEQNRHKHKGFRRQFIDEPYAREMGVGRELFALKKDGLVIPVEISLSPFHSEEAVLVTASIRDITERKKAEKELEESYKSIRRLTGYLQEIREEERTYIAREIHDELGQQLTVMMMDVAWLNKKIGKENAGAGEKIKELLEMLDNTVKTVRRISTELRPSVLDDLGLVPAIEMHLKDFETRSAILTQLTVPKQDLQLADPVKNTLFRIFQESLTNVARHSGAKKVAVKLEVENNNIVLMIEDNGIGFDERKAATKRTLGVLGMKERAAVIGGEYHISGKRGRGTIIQVKVPLHN